MVPGPRERGRLLPVLLVLLSYFAFATRGTMDPGTLALERQPHEGYQLLAGGFLRGRLGLAVDPPPALLALADPYDPAKSMGLAPYDTAYYQGRFYLVHGPLPALVFYLPLVLVFHAFPSGTLAVLCFGALNFLCLYAALIWLKDRYFPAVEEGSLILAGLVLGFGNLVLNHLASAVFFDSLSRSFYFVSCAAAEGALGFGVFALLRGLCAEEPSLPWLAAGSVGVAAAAAARPGMSAAVAAFTLAFCAWLWLSARSKSWRSERRWQVALAGCLPVLLIGSLLALYNYERFGQPLEFGVRYMMNQMRMEGSGFFDPSRLASNFWADLRAYFVQRPQFMGSFPFVRGLEQAVFVGEGKRYYEELIGFFWFWPAALLLPVLPWTTRAWTARQPAERDRLAVGLVLMGTLALAAMGLICSLSSVTYRYLADFAPLLLFLLILQFWMIEEEGPRWLGTLFAVSSGWGVLFSLAYSFWGYGGTYLRFLPGFLRGS